MRRADEVFWTRVFLFGASCVAGLIIARKRKLHRFHLHVLSSKAHDYGRFFGMDIGGSLAKLVYFQPTAPPAMPRHVSATRNTEGCLSSIEGYILSLHSKDRMRTAHREEHLELVVPHLGGTIHFCSFQTVKMDEITDFVRHRFFHRYIKHIACTGGGAYKFGRLFEEKLGIEILKEDEMDCLIRGLNFVLRHAKDECFTFTDVVLDTQGLGQATKKNIPTPPNDELYPFLLVNIGSGVSILKISGESQFERVSGTSLGGGTFWGLCKALSKLHTFDEAMDATVVGDSTAVDMTVGDIYGQAGYEQFGLKPSTVASSFGKMGMKMDPQAGIRDEDMARSLLFMLTQNLGQLAYLNAQRVNTSRIYFCGNFLRRNEIASRQLAYAIDFWSKSAMQAQFFHHEGFFGALGSLLTHWEAEASSSS
ncbi:hypothetical protein Poli38472_014495 [Pythium oligandrum]|uniref:pantothenate kinase n=2 Tax=Pythiaceae TaxID=4782 RepID=A0A8K1FHI1_PYTOL|nr:hypothetical protein Poli38472_014495 [Pythium oligandrum]DBA02599.1 TPA: hypothetical protein N0F65_011971 [Lagenidium giganteum]|eukprot:TMW61034.1 hypothetical protein Poli38472_014495 [Pythium oligandrum]